MYNLVSGFNFVLYISGWSEISYFNRQQREAIFRFWTIALGTKDRVFLVASWLLIDNGFIAATQSEKNPGDYLMILLRRRLGEYSRCEGCAVYLM